MAAVAVHWPCHVFDGREWPHERGVLDLQYHPPPYPPITFILIPMLALIDDNNASKHAILFNSAPKQSRRDLHDIERCRCAGCAKRRSEVCFGDVPRHGTSPQDTGTHDEELSQMKTGRSGVDVHYLSFGDTVKDALLSITTVSPVQE